MPGLFLVTFVLKGTLLALGVQKLWHAKVPKKNSTFLREPETLPDVPKGVEKSQSVDMISPLAGKLL